MVGTVISGYGLGYLLGAVVGGRFARGRLGLFMLVGNLAFAASLAFFALADTFPLWLAGCVLTGASGAMVLVSYVTLRAAIPPDALLGRVGSTARTISIGLAPLGMLAGGLLLDRIGGSATILFSAAAVAAITALFALSGALRAATSRSRVVDPGA